MDVFVLHHVRQIEEDSESVKLIGVYSSSKAAAAAIARLSRLPGFRDLLEGFNVDRYTIDEDNWTAGFGWTETFSPPTPDQN